VHGFGHVVPTTSVMRPVAVLVVVVFVGLDHRLRWSAGSADRACSESSGRDGQIG
jgi:hypothetical protein